MSDNLRQKTARGFIWGLCGQFAVWALNAVVISWLMGGRIGQGAYGCFAAAGFAVVTAIATQLVRFGMVQALVNLRDAQHRDYNSVFWFNIFVASGIYTVLFVVFPLISPVLPPMCGWVLFLSIPIAALGIVPEAYMAKRLMVWQNVVVNIVALVCSGGAGIALACLCDSGYEVWALICQPVVYATASTVGRYIVVPFRPSVRMTMKPALRMMRFGSLITVANIVPTLADSLRRTFLVFTGGSVTEYGLESIATSYRDAGVFVASGGTNAVAQPVMAELRDDSERSQRALRKLMRYTALVAFPLMFVLPLVAQSF